jgi:spore maturation protein SpmA
VLNYIWLALVLVAVAIGRGAGPLKEITDGAFDGAKIPAGLLADPTGVVASVIICRAVF